MFTKTPDLRTQKIENAQQAELSTKCAARDHFSFSDRNCDIDVFQDQIWTFQARNFFENGSQSLDQCTV